MTVQFAGVCLLVLGMIVAVVLDALGVKEWAARTWWRWRMLVTRPDGGDVIPRACPGPLIWYEIPPATPDGSGRALLECGARGCTYLIGSTTNVHDPAHRDTPLLRVPA